MGSRLQPDFNGLLWLLGGGEGDRRVVLKKGKFMTRLLDALGQERRPSGAPLGLMWLGLGHKAFVASTAIHAV